MRTLLIVATLTLAACSADPIPAGPGSAIDMKGNPTTAAEWAKVKPWGTK